MKVSVTAAEEARYAELQALALDHARRGETAPLVAMLAAGLPVNLADAKGNTLLMLACYHGHAETARRILEHGADADRRNDRGQTPLGGVAFKGHADVAEVLLAHGADPAASTGSGMTPLLCAALFGRTAVAERLHAHAASGEHRKRFGLPAGAVVSASRLVSRFLRR